MEASGDEVKRCDNLECSQVIDPETDFYFSLKVWFPQQQAFLVTDHCSKQCIRKVVT